MMWKLTKINEKSEKADFRKENQEDEKSATNPSLMAKNLLSLPSELVVMVASLLDITSYLALASSSSDLLYILISQLQWKVLLKRTKMGGSRLEVNGYNYESVTRKKEMKERFQE